MPSLDDPRMSESTLLREFLYGPSQTRKTFWAGKAAEAGFNVLLLNGDGHFHVLHNLKPEAKKRVKIIQCYDKLGTPRFSKTVARILKAEKPVIWDDDDSQIVYRNPDETHHHYVIDVTKLTHNDVLVVDSWTAITASIIQDVANEQMLDLSEADKLEWDIYRPAGMIATWMLKQLKGLPCHVIFIGHDMMWEKRRGGNDPRTKNDIVASRRQVVSVSGNHAKVLPTYFTDFFFFSVLGNNKFKVDGRPNDQAEGGSRTIPEFRDWEDLQFIDVIKASGCQLPTPDAEMPGCQFYKPGELPEGLVQAPVNNVLKSTAGTATVADAVAEKPKGLTALGIKSLTQPKLTGAK